jgi:putative oxidoreductase
MWARKLSQLVGYAIAVAVEVGGGPLLLLDIKTRLTAVALAIFTAATALAFHADFADQNQMIYFLKNLIITGGLLQVAAFSAGKFSVDARWGLNGVAMRAGTPHAIA